MSKDQPGSGLWSDSLQVNAVPCWKRRSKYAWIWAEFRLSVPADTEAIPIDRAPAVETQTTVVGLSENAVGGFSDKFRKNDGF